MLEDLAARVNADGNLVRRGKHVTTTFLIQIDDADHLISIAEGRITGIKPGPFITPNYSFALRAARDSWDKLWSPTPLPAAASRTPAARRSPRACSRSAMPSSA